MKNQSILYDAPKDDQKAAEAFYYLGSLAHDSGRASRTKAARERDKICSLVASLSLRSRAELLLVCVLPLDALMQNTFIIRPGWCCCRRWPRALPKG